MTVRRLMLLVAVAALAAGLMARRERFRGLADHHSARAGEQVSWTEGGRSGPGVMMIYRITPLGRWHQALAGKYREASSRPWLPVGPDPPPWATEADVPIAPPDPDPDNFDALPRPPRVIPTP